ncbi:MAG TPA: universal stress protein [Steroidobacteraceae bacterium]|jgi:nucleotide-binding universal stress UspA family protein|nr:universal stress protein [Steroidobacteraceae bacterium]
MRRILVAIDGSDTALRALDFAVKQASCAPAAKLHVLNVQPTLSNYTAAEIYVTAERLHEVAVERARAILEVAAGRLKSVDCSYELEQLEGDVAETIARRAAELGCESITMGTHGLGSFGILFLGSVAQRVVHHTTVPVTLVK